MAQPINREADLELKQALQAFDAARSWEESRAARDRVLALGPEAVPSVLAELSEPQPAEREDLLIELLLQWVSTDDLLEIVRSDEANLRLRGAIVEALGHRARDARASAASGRRIVATLAHVAQDDDPGIRITAVEAIGMAGVVTPEIEGLLRQIAAQDRNKSVQAEARAVLEEITR